MYNVDRHHEYVYSFKLYLQTYRQYNHSEHRFSSHFIQDLMEILENTHQV